MSVTEEATPLNDPDRDPDELTERQLEAAKLIADGLTLDEIADEMGVSSRTARYYSDAVRQKLGVRRKRLIGAELRARGLA